jgi:hypothetical protein
MDFEFVKLKVFVRFFCAFFKKNIPLWAENNTNKK